MSSELIPRSEPERKQQTASGAIASKPSRGVPRSCYSCSSKKTRCDRKEPCSSCTRAGRPCSYPPLGPRQRRTKKTIMEAMASRISSLEKSLAKVREEETSVPTAHISEIANSTPSPQPAPALHTDNLSERSSEDILVQKGSSSQYFNEILLSRVIGEVCVPMPSKEILRSDVLTFTIGAKHRVCPDTSSDRDSTPASIFSVQCFGHSLLSLTISSTC